MLQQMWAPWRLPYLQAGERDAGCFLCDLGREPGPDPCPDGTAAAEPIPDIVIWRGALVYALLNAYPYANGHVMVAPYRHEGALDALDEATAAELMTAARHVIGALRRTYRPEGFNVGANLGAAAGAGFGDHLHLHVVPRWSGDTNFMTTTGGARVIPESLASTAERLRAALSGDGAV